MRAKVMYREFQTNHCQPMVRWMGLPQWLLNTETSCQSRQRGPTQLRHYTTQLRHYTYRQHRVCTTQALHIQTTQSLLNGRSTPSANQVFIVSKRKSKYNTARPSTKGHVTRRPPSVKQAYVPATEHRVQYPPHKEAPRDCLNSRVAPSTNEKQVMPQLDMG